MKRFITLAIFVFAITLANAQLTLGPKFGANFSRINMDPEEIQPDDNSFKFGYQGGWVFNWAITDGFAIQQEVLFTQKGNKIENNIIDTVASEIYHTEYEEALTLNYIDLPLMFRFSFGDPMDKQFFFNVGPRLGFLVGGNTAWNSNTKKTQPDDGYKHESQGQTPVDESIYDHSEFGVDIGIGYDINTGPGHFVIDLRYMMGVSDILLEGAQTQAHIMKNQTMALSAIFLFGNTKPVVGGEIGKL